MPAKILIVDDTPANLLALTAVLEPLERVVVAATSGEQALTHLLSADFAVILLDVRMHGMDGFETAALIRGRERTRGIPIIFLTGFDSEFRLQRQAYDLGAFDYLGKPYDGDILRSKVAAFVRLYEQDEQLRRQAAELIAGQQATKLRDIFVAVLSHDLRTPLGAISLAASFLKGNVELPPVARKIAEGMVRAAGRMEHLVNDVLDFSRGHLGSGIPVATGPASLSDICLPIIDEFKTVHPERGITLNLVGRADGCWDPRRLGQVVANLIGNALQHGSGDVMVAIDGDGDSVRLTVTNAGHIPVEVQPCLFEPFKRGGSSPAGLGLGLYIVREIVRAHGGSVDVASTPEANTTAFIVELPRAARRLPSLHGDVDPSS